MVSLTGFNLDRSSFRPWGSILRDPDWRQRARFIERLHNFLDRLPPVERDVLHLYFVAGKRQEVIARLLNISQQAVSHRMYSAFRRVIFMMQSPDVCQAQMHEDLMALLKPGKSGSFAVDVLADFARTASQTATARNLNVPQQRVCWHVGAALRQLQAQNTVDAMFYAAYFERLVNHRRILRGIPVKSRRRTNGSRGVPQRIDPPGGAGVAPEEVGCSA